MMLTKETQYLLFSVSACEESKQCSLTTGTVLKHVHHAHACQAVGDAALVAAGCEHHCGL